MYPSWIPKKPKFKQNPESSTSFDCLNSSCGMDWSKKLGQQLTMEGIKENTSITHPGNFEDCAHEKFLKGQHMLIYYCGKKWGYYCRILHRCVESLPDWSHQPQIRWREVAWLPSLQLLYVGLVEKKKHQGNKHIMGLVSQYDVCFTLLREVLFCHLCLALWDAWPLEEKQWSFLDSYQVFLSRFSFKMAAIHWAQKQTNRNITRCIT